MSGYSVLRADELRFEPPSCSPDEPVQEEVFCVVEGTLTMYLGEPPERVELPPRSVVVVEPQTPLQLRNESDDATVFFAYGAPAQPSDYKADVLEDAYLP